MNRIKEISKQYFSDSKYTDLYFKIIDKYGNFEYSEDTYCEKHHIIPRSIDESLTFDSENIVRVSMRVHVILHKLLTKMCINTRDYFKMVNAICVMCCEEKMQYFRISSRYVEQLRKIAAENRRKPVTFDGMEFESVFDFYNYLSKEIGWNWAYMRVVHETHKFTTIQKFRDYYKIMVETKSERAIANLPDTKQSITFEGVYYSQMKYFYEALAPMFNSTPNGIKRYYNKYKFNSYQQLKEIIEINKELIRENSRVVKGRSVKIVFDGVEYNSKRELQKELSEKLNCCDETIARYFREKNIETYEELMQIFENKKNNKHRFSLNSNSKNIVFSGVEYSNKTDLYEKLGKKYNLSSYTIQKYFLENDIKNIDELEVIIKKFKNNKHRTTEIYFNDVKYEKTIDLYKALAKEFNYSWQTIQEYFLENNIKNYEQLKNLVEYKRTIRNTGKSVIFDGQIYKSRVELFNRIHKQFNLSKSSLYCYFSEYTITTTEELIKAINIK